MAAWKDRIIWLADFTIACVIYVVDSAKCFVNFIIVLLENLYIA